MSDNLRRYHAIRDALHQWYPGQLTGTGARHLTTLAALISGIVGSKRMHLPHIATQVPDGATPESRVKRFARWIGNDTITEDVYFVPYAEVLLRQLALQTLVLVMDGSVVGRGCVALMIHVGYKSRALPLAWLVRPGKEGHFPEDLHSICSRIWPRQTRHVACMPNGFGSKLFSWTRKVAASMCINRIWQTPRA
jgi:hypothetical protein